MQKIPQMKHCILIIISLAFFYLVGNAQYYNPYYNSNANQQAYEWGRRMAEQQQAQTRNNPNACIERIVYFLALRDLSQAEDWADALAYIDEANGYYYAGLINELMGQTSYAKRMYAASINAGNKYAKTWLNRLNANGEFTESEKENIYSYYLNMYSNVSSASAAIVNNIWGNSGKSNSSRRSSSKSNCAYCHGTGYDPTPYNHSASSDSYLNPAGNTCRYCDKQYRHYHYKCRHH